jgi:hypothetical protein
MDKSSFLHNNESKLKRTRCVMPKRFGYRLVNLFMGLLKLVRLVGSYLIGRWVRPHFTKKPFRIGDKVIDANGEKFKVVRLHWSRTKGRWGYHVNVITIPSRQSQRNGLKPKKRRGIPAGKLFSLAAQREQLQKFDPMGPLHRAFERMYHHRREEGIRQTIARAIAIGTSRAASRARKAAVTAGHVAVAGGRTAAGKVVAGGKIVAATVARRKPNTDASTGDARLQED